jgi:hypothetical protein
MYKERIIEDVNDIRLRAIRNDMIGELELT